MFKVVKGFKKEDLKWVLAEIGEEASSTATLALLKEIIMKSDEYRKDPEFVQTLLESAIDERKLEQENEEKRREQEHEREQEKVRLEQEKVRLAHELELAKIQSFSQQQGDSVVNSNENGNIMRRKFTLPKLEFRKFGGEVRDWLQFWSQFEQIDKDEEIANEDKFQYLVQATIVGSRARDLVESFPPSGDNYVKAIESLKSRFGRKDIQVEVYIRELLRLIISVQTKCNVSLTSLYDKLESYLRALETLGVTADKYASILYPMVESCFPADFLKTWNRAYSSSSKIDAKERLDDLMQFIKIEVESEERISLATAGFGLTKWENNKQGKINDLRPVYSRNKTATAAGLLTAPSTYEAKKTCVFCQGKHLSAECFTARKMSLIEVQRVAKEKKCCFACLVPGHIAKRCRAFLRCIICSRRHVPLMCKQRKTQDKPAPERVGEKPASDVLNMSNQSGKNVKVFLQTLKVKLITNNKKKSVRLLLDSASQKSYILKNVAEEMNYNAIREEKIIHSLFGGITTKERQHNIYRVTATDVDENFTCSFEVLDQSIICENIQPVTKGPWTEELKKLGIKLSDVGEQQEAIDLLIGADIMGKLLTGRKELLSSGLVAVETYLGWTLMGKIPQEQAASDNLAMVVTSLFVNNADIANLWRLDLIGIIDPVEKKSKNQIDCATKEHFLETIKVNNEGRYEVQLPWEENVVELPNNFNTAVKRLESTTAKLLSKDMYRRYENIFLEWLREGIIEEVPTAEMKSNGYYLPHHPVIKESSSTTPIRPVFDASAKILSQPSLNQCLQCGPNLIELIPDILFRFRERKIGVIADIRKAFLQISICEQDRDVLRFLWWENLEDKRLRVFRHARVVFGVKCSPFLLSAVIEYHIENSTSYDDEFKQRLLHSFYVDNVVTSVHSERELQEFMSNSKILMDKGGFDLRQWEYNRDCVENYSKEETQVLGLIWNKVRDTLRINMKWLENFNSEKITKRKMLSAVHKNFDPFGFTAPVMLYPKLMLQKAWKLGISWDDEITGEIRKQFLQWLQHLKFLSEIEIPRFMQVNLEDLSKCSIHTFVDGSKDAYAAVIFLRVELKDEIKVVFIAAKSRVAPLKSVTIPRMELLAATIGARLAKTVIDALGWHKLEKHYWSDSETVLAWLTRKENWSVFVRNRVQEIRNLAEPSLWKYVPSDKNPADLPSRGCTAKHLAHTRWWEGPKWMKQTAEFEFRMKSSMIECDEEEVQKEKLKSVQALTNSEMILDRSWYFNYFSKYEKIIRMIAWILRFKINCLNQEKLHGELSAAEFQEAEIRTLRMVQKESFSPEDDLKLKTLQTYKDKDDIIRLKTKIVYRKDNEDFLRPIVLPSKHEVVKRLILHVHLKNCHAGLQILLNLLREKYWIINARRNVKFVLASCTICKRFNSKSLWANSAPLPENRIKDARVFQVIGIDMAGPVYLKNNKKTWILIFTCAIYRAVHFELTTSASTDAFLMAFRRFVARRGRCSIIYCDNGKNFVGAYNLMKNLDWKRLQRHGAVNSIEWKFNPPTAAWWGGFWERLIRIMKDLLKRVLGRAYLNYEEMVTTLTEVESVINSRPLTYISEEEAVNPISPSMFLQEVVETNLPEVDAIEQTHLSKRLQYRQTLLKDIKNRFRSEYLGALIQRDNRKRSEQVPTIGDIVLIGSDNKKRIHWPLGRIIEIYPGKDKKVRLVKVQTSQHELLRPVQRIYPLEIVSSNDCPDVFKKRSTDTSRPAEQAIVTDEKPGRYSKYGRKINLPDRLILF